MEYSKGKLTKEPVPFTQVPNELAPIFEFLAERGVDSLKLVKSLFEPGLYAVVPISILERKDLSANAKLLYAEITALSKRSGLCIATNDYLGKMLGLKERTLPKIMQELESAKLIKRIIKRSSKGTYRSVQITFNAEGGSLTSEGGVRSTTRPGVANERGQKRYRQRDIDKENNLATPNVVAGNGLALDRLAGKKSEEKKETSKDIVEIVELFKEVNPVTYQRFFKDTTQRKAIARLLKAFPRPQLDKIIVFLPTINQIKYAPHAHTPYELESKVVAIRDFVKAERGAGKGKEILGL